MKILCIGDSLTLPRKGCDYSDTWIARIKTEFQNCDFICNFKGGMLIKDAFQLWDYYYKYSKIDYVILQEGICDCSPRHVNENSYFWRVIIKIAEKIRVSKFLWWLIKLKPRSPSCTFTSRKSFVQFSEKLMDGFFSSEVKAVIIIKIGYGAPTVTSRSKYFNSNVDEYNAFFEKLKVKFGERIVTIDPLKKVNDDMFVDGYHCNAEGMKAVYIELSNVLHKLFD